MAWGQRRFTSEGPGIKDLEIQNQQEQLIFGSMRAVNKTKVQRGRHRRAYSRTLYPPESKPCTGVGKTPQRSGCPSRGSSPGATRSCFHPCDCLQVCLPTCPPQGTRDAIPEAQAEDFGKTEQYQRGDREKQGPPMAIGCEQKWQCRENSRTWASRRVALLSGQRQTGPRA